VLVTILCVIGAIGPIGGQGSLVSPIGYGAPSVGIMKWEPDVPRWRQVYEVMRERIVDGTYSPGERLPSVVDVCAEFGISQMTARRVLKELRAEKLAFMEPGIGTFVTELPDPPAS